MAARRLLGLVGLGHHNITCSRASLVVVARTHLVAQALCSKQERLLLLIGKVRNVHQWLLFAEDDLLISSYQTIRNLEVVK